jgi:hypothetical protein
MATCEELQRDLDVAFKARAQVPEFPFRAVISPSLEAAATFLDGEIARIKAAGAAQGCVLEDRPGVAFLDVVGATQSVVQTAIGAAGGVIGKLPEILKPAVKGVADLLVTALRGAGFLEEADMIDTSGEIVKFIASVEDAMTREDLLTSRPLSYQDALKYEDQLSGKVILVVLLSKFYSMAIEVMSLGQLETQAGFILNLVDRIVGDTASVVSSQLTRRAVAEPLQAGMKRLHRHTELSTSEAEESFALGLLPDAEYVDVLVSNGFTDRAIQRKVELGRVRALNQAGVFPLRAKFISPSTLISAYKAGIVSNEELLGELARQGYDDVALSVFWGLAQLKVAPASPPGA